jgi:hypothetical protein
MMNRVCFLAKRIARKFLQSARGQHVSKLELTLLFFRPDRILSLLLVLLLLLLLLMLTEIRKLRQSLRSGELSAHSSKIQELRSCRDIDLLHSDELLRKVLVPL